MQPCEPWALAAIRACPPAMDDGIEALLRQVRQAQPQLSPQLQRIAAHVLQHAELLALERIQDVARRCEVQPSAVVRFAQHFGLSGFHELKRRLSCGRPVLPPPRTSRYRERLRQAAGELSSPQVRSAAEVACACIDGAATEVRRLQQTLPLDRLTDAIALLARARTVWIVGARRAHPVACHLAYAMQGLAAMPVHLVSFAGAMHESQLGGLRGGDVLLAASFAPYAPETLLAAQRAVTAGVPVVAITDDEQGALAAEASVVLPVDEQAHLGFRGLTATMTLAQALFLGLAFALDDRTEPPA